MRPAVWTGLRDDHMEETMKKIRNTDQRVSKKYDDNYDEINWKSKKKSK